MSKGSNSTVTNVQALPPAVEAALTQAYTDFNPFSSAFDAVSSFDPTASKVGTAALSTGEQNAITAANNLLANQPAFLGTAQQNLGGLMGGAVDNTALADQLGLTADTTNLQNLFGVTTDTSDITDMAGQQNAATQILSDLTTQDTNPFLQQQIDDAIGGAVDRVSSQYALGGRLGSDSFADALGAGITGAAAPILSQNLQQDRANQLAAARALGQVSGQDIGRALQGATTAAQIGQQDLGQQANIAQSLLGAQQADLSRDATLANQLTAASEADARARLAAIGAAPGLLGADQALISQAAQLGGLERGIDQARLDAIAAQANQQNILDQNELNAYLSAAGLGSGLFGSTTTQSGGAPTTLNQGLGGALAGAGLAQTIGSSAFTPAMGALGGAGLGLLGFLSDRRLKKDIKQIGTHANGLAMYSWEWNDEAQSRGFDIYPTEGFMAQEANELYPQHVHVHPSGYLMLDYASLSNEAMGAA